MKIMLIAVLLLLVVPAQAQLRPDEHVPVGRSLAEILAGQVVPVNLMLKDLTGEWYRITTEEEETHWLFGPSILRQGTNSNGVFYTKGDMASIGGQEFILAYERREGELDQLEISLGKKSPTLLSTTPETRLELVLIRVDAIKILKQMRRFDLQQEIALTARINELLTARNPYFKEISTSQSNLYKLGLALRSYSQDHRGQLPPLTESAAIRAALQPYVADQAIFSQPSTNAEYRPNISLSKKILDQIPEPQAVVIFYEPTARPDGTRIVLFADGHVKQINEDEWLRLKKTSSIP